MADFTKLNGYTVKDPNAIHTYDTIADLKADTKLKAGNHAQTKGYATAGDGGHATYIIVDDNTLVDDGGSIHALTNGLFAVMLIDGYVTPEMFGAKGDGVTDDHNALQAVLNLANIPIKLISKYYTSVGLTSSKPRNIFSDNSDCGIYGNTENFILKFERDINNPADYRNNFIRNITISQRGSGNALEFAGWGDYLMELKIDNCKIFTPYNDETATGYAIYASNSLAHCVIYGCTIQGNGIYGEFRDANVIQKNMFFGNGNGIKLDIPNGCLNNIIKDNTFSTFGGNAIFIANGEQIVIQNNQIEYADTFDQTSLTKGMIYLAGVERRCKHIMIIDNNFGGGMHLDYALYLANTDDVIVDRNRFVAVNEAEIYIGAGSNRAIIRDGNYGVSQVNNPRTGKDRLYLIEDHGNGTMGVWRSISAQGSPSHNLEYKKDENGFIHFKPVFLSSLTNLTVCQLPMYYRPSNSIEVLAISNTGDEEIKIKISYDGTITLISAPTTQEWIFIQGGYEANKYA